MNFELTIGHLNFYAWILFWAFMYIRYWEGIWKGVCGGNGIPQPDEWVRFIAGIVFICECGAIMFLDKEMSFSFMILILGTIGVTSIKNMSVDSVMPGLKKKPKTSE